MLPMSRQLARVVFVVLSLLAPSAHAGRTVPEVKAFIKKQNACVFAFADVVKNAAEPPDSVGCHDRAGQLVHGCAGRAQVVCIFDSVMAAGTIDEKRGCSIAWYDFAENSYMTFTKDDIFIPLQCTKVVVTKILTRPSGEWGALAPIKEIPLQPKAPPFDVTALGLYPAAVNAIDPAVVAIEILADRFNVKKVLAKTPPATRP